MTPCLGLHQSTARSRGTHPSREAGVPSAPRPLGLCSTPSVLPLRLVAMTRHGAVCARTSLPPIRRAVPPAALLRRLRWITSRASPNGRTCGSRGRTCGASASRTIRGARGRSKAPSPGRARGAARLGGRGGRVSDHGLGTVVGNLARTHSTNGGFYEGKKAKARCHRRKLGA